MICDSREETSTIHQAWIKLKAEGKQTRLTSAAPLPVIRLESSDWSTAWVRAPESETPRTCPDVRNVYETEPRVEAHQRREVDGQVSRERDSLPVAMAISSLPTLAISALRVEVMAALDPNPNGTTATQKIH